MMLTLWLHGSMKTARSLTLKIAEYNFVQKRRGVHSAFASEQRFMSYKRNWSSWCYDGRQTELQTHVNDICNHASRQTKSFKQFAKYPNIDRCFSVYSSFIQSNFSYCPISWLLYGRKIAINLWNCKNVPSAFLMTLHRVTKPYAKGQIFSLFRYIVFVS